MELTVTVVRAGERVDVGLRCHGDAAVGEVLDALSAHGLADADAATLVVDGRALDRTVPAASCLVHGAVLATESRLPALAPGEVSQWQVRVVAGPRCGDVHPLQPGATVVGRGPAAGIRLDDGGVSREHVRVGLSGDEVDLSDHTSTNGSRLDGALLSDTRTPWPLGRRLRVGRTALELHPPGAPALPPDAVDGRVAVRTPPRLRSPSRRTEVRLPAAPARPRPTPFPVAAAAAPLLVGVVAAGVLRSPTFLLFALLSPVMVLAQSLADRRASRREHQEALRRHAAETRQRLAEIDAEVRAEQDRRREADPDCAALAEQVRLRGPRVWERRAGDDDVLRLRLGTGDLPASVHVPGGRVVACEDVPVTVDLPAVGSLGLVGDRSEVLAVARAAVASAAALHAPSVLRLAVLAPGRYAEWGWARWLPHGRHGGQEGHLLALAPDEVEARLQLLLAELTELTGPPAPRDQAGARRVLVVVDDPRLRDHPAVVRLTSEGPAAGVHVLTLAGRLDDLPAACPAVFSAESSDGWLLRRDGAETVPAVTPDGVTATWAERLARGLAPLQLADTTPESALPESVTWRELAGLRLTGHSADASTVGERWQQPPRAAAALGVTADGTVLELDLRRDGPHCLLAGTTGSGKSELLQTLVAGLALASPPEHLQLLLVDYKGGAAFGSCAALPHTAGVVTDLDPALTRRALASLAAELRRRESLLAAAGSPDLDAYEERRTGPDAPGLPVVPRLVLVVDEFATLAEELPEFVRGLVAVAQRGRSLGVHLVLATQRPEGSVSQDIRANTALRLCLAVPREAESRDVLDGPDAARLDRRQPGRGFLRRGPGPLTLFQGARVTVAPHADEPEDSGPVLLVTEPWTSRPALQRQQSARCGVTDLDLLVAACTAAAQVRGHARPASPWLPPLPHKVTLDDLDRVDDGPRRGDARPQAPGPAQVRIPLALQDDPHRQSRRVLTLDLSAHLAVVGGPRSGRTTTLLTVAGAAAGRIPADRLHVVGLDCGTGGLRALDRLPHCATLVGGDEPDRVARLVAALGRELTRRLAVARTAEATAAGDPSGRSAPEPHLLLLIDQWDAFVTAHGDSDAGRLVDGLVRVLRDGPAVGITAVVSSDRSLLVGRVSGLLPHRLLLPLPDPGDYATAGIAPRDVPTDLGPGRGVHSDGRLTQVALLDGDPARQHEALAELAGRLLPPPAGAAEPLRVDPLPARVALTDAAALRLRPRPPGRIVTPGVGGDRLEPLDVDLDETGSVLLVGGPPRSGRSTALLTLLQSVADHAVPARLVVVAPRPSPLRALGDRPGAVLLTDPCDAAPLTDALVQPVVLLVDDAELLTDTALGFALDSAVPGLRDTGTVLLAAGTTSSLLGAYRGWVTDLRRGRSGLLLSPETAADGELFGCRLRSADCAPGPVGRGVLVVRGMAQALQVALPGPQPLRPAEHADPVRALPSAPDQVRSAA